MATYKGINGYAVQSIASDPTLDEGQIWYNNATYAFKLAAVTTAGTWASGGNLNTGRNGNGGFGTQTSALSFGGDVPPITAATELYNGTSWTNSTSMTTARRRLAGASAGPSSSTAAFGGQNPSAVATAATEEWTGPGAPVTRTITTS